MLKKRLLIFNFIFLIVMLVSTTCFAANYTVDLFEGETSEEYESTSTEYTEPDNNIATINATLGGEMVTVYKAGTYDLDSARYTFTSNGNNYNISANGVNLYLGNNQVNNTNQRTITVTANNGGYRFSYNQGFTRYLKYNNGFTSATGNSGNRNFYLYQKDPSGVGDGNGIPGYNRVTSITNGGEYLIVYPNGGNYYILYPTTTASAITQVLTETQEGEPSKYSFTGVTSGTTTATIGNDTYTINVYKRPDGTSIDDQIMVRRGDTYTIQTNIEGLTFSSLDTSIATVNSTTGVVTGVAQGSTQIKAVAPDGTMYLIPTSVYNNLYTVTVNLDADEHSNVYYAENYTTIHAAGKQDTIVFNQPSGTFKVFNIYAAPDEGYAIVKMQGTMTVINDDTPGEIRNGISSSFIARHLTPIGRATIASHLENARAMNIEGTNGYTREASSNTNYTENTFTILSEKLPTMTSNIYSVNGVPYQAGDPIKPGDTIVYEVNVNKDEAGQYLITENGSITSSLTGTTYIGTTPTGNTTSNSIEIDAGDTFNENYYFSYTVPNDASGTINNTFTMNYDTYSGAAIHTTYSGNDLSYKMDRSLISNTSFEIAAPEYEIKFSNTVYGNAGDQDKYFKYRIDIDVEDGEEFVIQGQDATIEYEGQTINTSNKYKSGYVNYIYLKHGQEATIVVKSLNNVDYNNRIYTITQQDGSDYETRVNNVVTKTAGPIQITDNSSAINFINFKEIAPQTFVNLEIVPFVWLLAFTLMGLILLKKKR